MLIWMAMLVPVITSVILLLFFRRKTVWWEFLLPFLVSIVCIQTSKMVAVSVATTDTEYWGSYGATAAYYEAWNERVSCRHPEYCTRTVTDLDGHTSTESYQCGWEHAYDVDYHSPYWELQDSIGETFPVDMGLFESLAKRWGNRTFVDLNRHYHSIDGDKYVTKWDGRDETLEPVVTKHSYVNRVQASSSIFKFSKVTLQEKSEYGLYDYPSVSTYCPSIMGTGPKAEIGNRYLDVWNAKMGPKRQVRMWVLIFQNQSSQAGILQEAYWNGGNKNEVVVCIGTDKQWNVTWCKAFSWTEKTGLLASIRDRVTGNGKELLDLGKVAKITVEETSKGFLRRQFHEFDYLTVEPGGWAIVWTFVITIAVNIGISFYVVGNRFEDKPVGFAERIFQGRSSQRRRML